jgi:hypothetical protein
MRRLRAWASIDSPQPARDLLFVDAAALLTALFVGYGIRAAVSANYPLAWSGVAPYVRIALPVALCALLLSAAALGLYGDRAVRAGVREHLAAVAYAAAVATVVGVYWGGPATPTVSVAAVLALCVAAAVYAARRLYWRLAD